MADNTPVMIEVRDRSLWVDGVRQLLRGAELHNSSATTIEEITASFDAVQALGANVVLAAVAWEQFEPEEGRFDTALIDEMIGAARTRGLRLIPLWFGSWKNGKSSYAPGWVLDDPDRFPRAELTGGVRALNLSPFGEETVSADARAFTALTERISARDHDGAVVMIQVENEVGLLGDSRDRSALADRVFASEIPQGLIDVIDGAPNLRVRPE